MLPHLTTFTSTPHSESKAYLESTLNESRLHPHFAFEDGDLILSTATVDFRVHANQIVPRSCAFQLVLKMHEKPVFSDGIYHFSNLTGSMEAWACLLAVIYNERASSGPSFQEVFCILSISGYYQFDNVHTWALARLRADFFQSPQRFYLNNSHDESEKPCSIEEAFEVYCCCWVLTPPSRLGIEVRALAGYALLQHDVFALCRKGFRNKMTPSDWNTLCAARVFIENEFRVTSNAILTRPLMLRDNIEHDAKLCTEMLTVWLLNVRHKEPDVLKALYHLQSDVPPAQICRNCVFDAQLLARVQLRTLPTHLASCFGMPTKIDWSIREDIQHSLTRESLLAPIKFG